MIDWLAFNVYRFWPVAKWLNQ